MKKGKNIVNNKVILNLIQDLQRLSLQLVNNVRGRFQIKFGMTALYNNDAFTLIELLVVVLIIGILAAVAIPQYQVAVAKSRLATIKSLVENVASAEEVYYLANGKYTADVKDLDVSVPGGWTEGENQETDGVITKREYVFNWGKCWINATQFTCSVDISNVLVYYKKYYEHAATPIKRRCIVRTTDLGHVGNKLCKNETLKTKPDHPQSPVDYLEWWYN